MSCGDLVCQGTGEDRVQKGAFQLRWKNEWRLPGPGSGKEQQGAAGLKEWGGQFLSRSCCCKHLGMGVARDCQLCGSGNSYRLQFHMEGDVTGVVNTQYNLQMVCYRTVRLKPV